MKHSFLLKSRMLDCGFETGSGIFGSMCLYKKVFSFMVFVESTEVAKTLHDGNNQLTARFFSEVVKKNQGKSIVLSAFSLITPLSQLAVASEGPSHDELLAAVGFPDDAVTSEVFGLINGKYKSIEGVELKQASKLYIPLGYEVHDQFASVSKNVYHSEVANINFGDSQKAAKEINDWVENQTNKRIKDLVDSSSITPDTRGILVNALYFKGSWKYPFRELATSNQDFYVNKQKTIQIPIMHNTDNYRYIESETLKSKILEIPYEGDQSSFVVILPNDIEGIEYLIEKLKDPNIIDKETQQMWNVEVRVSLPKFKIETTTDLKEALMNMNVTKMFGGEANLIKLLKTDEKLFISDAKQKAFIEVNEKGAEAAAANVFAITDAIAIVQEPTFDFVADHPFAYYLKAHREILFNGIFYGS